MTASRGRKLALLLGSTLVSLLLAELAFRVALRLEGAPYDSAAVLAKLERDADTLKAFTPAGVGEDDRAKRVLHPYYGAENGVDPGGVLQHFASTPPDAVFEVLVVGGSVASLFCRDAGQDLELALAADPRLAGRTVRVLHGAHGAYKQPQQLNKVAYIFAHGYRPDVVVNLDGFNEVANGFNNGMSGINPLYPSPTVWAGVLWVRGEPDPELADEHAELTRLSESYKARLATAKRLGLLHSAIAGTWVRSRLGSIQARRVALEIELTELHDPQLPGTERPRTRELSGEPYVRETAAIMDLAVKSWVECSISLHALCAARGVPYLHALQPTLWDIGAKPIAPEESQLTGGKYWREGVESGYPRLRESIPLLRAAGVDFLDLSRHFAEVQEPLYVDPCHFSPEGAKLLVNDFARAILALLD